MTLCKWQLCDIPLTWFIIFYNSWSFGAICSEARELPTCKSLYPLAIAGTFQLNIVTLSLHKVNVKIKPKYCINICITKTWCGCRILIDLERIAQVSVNPRWLPDSFLGMRCKVYRKCLTKMGMKMKSFGRDELFFSLYHVSGTSKLPKIGLPAWPFFHISSTPRCAEWDVKRYTINKSQTTSTFVVF